MDDIKIILLTNSTIPVLVREADYNLILTLSTNWGLLSNKNGKPVSIRSTKAFFKNGTTGKATHGAKQIYLARFIMGVHKEDRYTQVDHINQDIFDNRRENLRICNFQQNRHNQKDYGNKTGFKWVTKRGENNYSAEVNCNDKKYYLGRFTSAEEAAKAANEKAMELHQEFALLNNT